VHGTDDAAVFGGVGGIAGFLRPAREIFAVEQIDPVFFGEELLGCEQANC